METELATAVAQFGVAGLIGWMWLSERRAASAREKQITEAHDRIMSDGTTIDVLVRAVENNTRAVTALETGQRRLTDAIERRAAPEPDPDAATRRA